jgi:hypothetical protein
VLVIALSYGIAGASLTVAVLSLAMNLLCTGVFIVIVKKLIAPAGDGSMGAVTRSPRAEFPIESTP